MTAAPANTYAQGVRDVLALARRSAVRIEAGTTRPIPISFAAEALRALADEAEALLLASRLDGAKTPTP